MAIQEHLDVLRRGVPALAAWRGENLDVRLDLSEADLSRADLSRADLSRADLSEADLSGAILADATLTKANLSGAILADATLTKANLSRANLFGADLSRADLLEASLFGANLQGANLTKANLFDASLIGANLFGANLFGANLTKANLTKANLSKANLFGTTLFGATLIDATLTYATLTYATLTKANLTNATLTDANFSGTTLFGANLTGANLTGAILADATLTDATLTRAVLVKANLSRANLSGASMVEVDLEEANLTGCRVYGISAWSLKLKDAKQSDLVITPWGQPEVTVDHLEVAQFIYLMLHNEKIRHVIDTVTSKVVLILGRFSDERKSVLDAIREELRKRDLVSVMFDFSPSSARNLTETVTLLARMARFVIADLTDPRSLPQELQAMVPDLPSVPVQPVILSSQYEYAMFSDFLIRDSVLELYRYKDQADLLAHIDDKVIRPAQERRELITMSRDLGRSPADLLAEKTEEIKRLKKEVQRLLSKGRSP